VTHHGSAPLLVTGLVLTAAVAYLVVASGVPRWPVGRTVRWLLGVAAVGAALLGPLGSVGGAAHDLRAHVAGHLLLGMLAPLLLVSAAPVTLALRALPHRRARVLARLLRSRPVAVVTHPAVAALTDVGGLWLLYRTDLYALAAARPPLLAVVHLHMLLAGYLFAFSLIGPDPAPHRPGLAVRAGVLVLAVAAHDVLAKLLYAAPPPGVAPMPEAGMLMHYGALPVHVALFVLLGREWAAGQERARRRAAPVGTAIIPRTSEP